MFLDFIQPSLNTDKRFFIGYVVHNQASNRFAIMSEQKLEKCQFTYALVIALNLSYPAVSQICAFTVPPVLSGTALVANSTPMVGLSFLGSALVTYRLSKWVLPTSVSPTKITNSLVLISKRLTFK